MVVYFSIGSNFGNRHVFFHRAIYAMRRSIGNIKAVSHFYETEPVGKPDQPWFLNCCLEIETALSPEYLLSISQDIENTLGRERREKWGQRTIDLDILFYGDLVFNTAVLGIPHPLLHKRHFVLVPLAEIAPNFSHPLLKKSINELLKECPDTSIVRALHGNPSTQKTRDAIPDRHSLGSS